MEKRENEVMEIDLLRLLQAMWRRAWLIILAMVIGGGAAFYVSAYAIAPTYESSALLYVNNSNISVGGTSISLQDLTASQSLVNTYIVILKTRRTLNEVIEEAELNYSYDELKEMITASSEGDTEIFSVTVTSKIPEEAAKIANTITEVLPDKIAEIVDGCSVRTVDFAVTPTKKAAPSITKYTAMGMLLGLVLSGGVIILLELMDDQIHDEDYLLRTYDLPILASIPNLLEAKPRKNGYYYKDYYGPAGPPSGIKRKEAGSHHGKKA